MPRSTGAEVPDGADGSDRTGQNRRADEFRQRQLRRRRWLSVGGALVFLLTVAVVAELIVAGGDGNNDDDRAVNSGAPEVSDAAASEDAVEDTPDGPVPGDAPEAGGVGELPSGGTVTARGDGDYRGVGSAGMTAGDPDRDDADTYSFVVEVENGLETSSFGGGDAFAAAVDATLSDPRSWISDGTFAFRHVSVTDRRAPDLRIRLTSPETTREVCGVQIELETSCFVQGPDVEGERRGAADAGRVIVNAARWVRGATTFEGDLGSYRQYLLNHEVGHGLGFARHQVCAEDGVLAPVMMQQTLSLNIGELEDLEAGAQYGAVGRDVTCRPNSWPYPHGRSEGDPVDVRD
ncbi:DUF3152 domain-containing protein [Corynebacterium glyciniphilum]|uniref:DUF3152 domain-containing protein n=1 Tax=Corynebacterium glyciniphilum TaxID=1404244 RepID=UPI002650CEC0|nr:DUF3152 domain-containing protein [Corynebacterium glyciniphilum]MDN6706532.1 DUF3152 domain-containing protein [Corynebacterium glyciniphilum]